MNTTFIFVYNAKSGLFNKLTGFAHKILSPQTYACQLCQITHSNLGMHPEWQNFLKELPVLIEFDYRDTFIKKHGFPEADFPAIYQKSGRQVKLAIDATSIRACRTITDLQRLVLQQIQSPTTEGQVNL
ncbi:MAG: hypothetical protein H6695_11445 [Deferribacteres bacterium]|nr:hypothetical protein [candidate division KSB1 bacterium]MCB9510792.1 hypothetical protein [Deferribacteres bacterium]